MIKYLKIKESTEQNLWKLLNFGKVIGNGDKNKYYIYNNCNLSIDKTKYVFLFLESSSILQNTQFYYWVLFSSIVFALIKNKYLR